MDRFPHDVNILIWEMDPEKREKFNRVAHQLRLRNVFWQLCDRSWYDEPWLRMTPYPEYDRDGRMEAMLDAMIHECCMRHRVLGRRPRLPFDEFELMGRRVALNSII